MTKLGLGLAVWLLSPSAWAQSVDITLNPRARSLLSGQLGLDEAQIEQLIADQIRGVYSLADVPEYLRLSANAQSMANKGLGVDYASTPDGFLFGIAANLTASGGDTDIQSLVQDAPSEFDRAIPVSAGAQITLMVGYNFASAGLPGLTVFLHGLYYPLSVAQLDGRFFNFGGHAQYRLFGPLGNKAVFQWGGLSFTSGLEVSSMKLTLEDQLETEGELVQNFNLRTLSRGSLEIRQGALTIPIEVSTDLRLLYFVSVYGGFGVDFQLGDSELLLNLDSELEADDPLNGGNLEVGTAQISVDNIADPDAVLFRFFGGLQANLGPVKIFTQLNVATQDATLSVALGARVVF